MNDDFFRRCWLTLKATNPRLRKRMTEIECGLEGIRVREQQPSSKKKNEVKTNDSNDDDSDKIIPV